MCTELHAARLMVREAARMLDAKVTVMSHAVLMREIVEWLRECGLVLRIDQQLPRLSVDGHCLPK